MDSKIQLKKTSVNGGSRCKQPGKKKAEYLYHRGQRRMSVRTSVAAGYSPITSRSLRWTRYQVQTTQSIKRAKGEPVQIQVKTEGTG
ncbi:hypothetical protein AVEN_209796-1 [Araneus ventricosus]|uniref:Uncharacterized protein n=1 Tax=Araneus ventricosus TaxID=182803 RepID=A0A4Y2QJP8_ARAVE|nr:hypothetical protein AVEN_209796-1 [Araneus ventricosus]